MGVVFGADDDVRVGSIADDAAAVIQEQSFAARSISFAWLRYQVKKLKDQRALYQTNEQTLRNQLAEQGQLHCQAGHGLRLAWSEAYRWRNQLRELEIRYNQIEHDLVRRNCVNDRLEKLVIGCPVCHDKLCAQMGVPPSGDALSELSRVASRVAESSSNSSAVVSAPAASSVLVERNSGELVRPTGNRQTSAAQTHVANGARSVEVTPSATTTAFAVSSVLTNPNSRQRFSTRPIQSNQIPGPGSR